MKSTREEVYKAIDGDEGDHELRKIIRKIAGICVHCLEINGVIERKINDEDKNKVIPL